MPKFACCYAQCRPGARAFRAAVAKVLSPDDFQHCVAQFFPRDANPPAAGIRSPAAEKSAESLASEPDAAEAVD